MADEIDWKSRKDALVKRVKGKFAHNEQPAIPAAGPQPLAPGRPLTPLQQASRGFNQSKEVAQVLNLTRAAIDTALGKNAAEALSRKHSLEQNLKVVGLAWMEMAKSKIEAKLHNPFGPRMAKSVPLKHEMRAQIASARLPKLKIGRIGAPLPRFSRTLARWENNIAPHGRQPHPISTDGTGRTKESHHLESQTHLKQVVANYDPRKDWTLLLNWKTHGLTKRPQNAIMHARGYSKATIAKRQEYYEALGRSKSIEKAYDIVKQAGVPNRKAYEAVLRHDGYLKGTTPLKDVKHALSEYWKNHNAYMKRMPLDDVNEPLRKYWEKQRIVPVQSSSRKPAR
jgi:hypothetical protein